jgi:hypothetical protein
MVWIPFSTYLANSFKGVLSDSLFIGILLALIVSDLRRSKYFKWEDYITKDYWIFNKHLLKFLAIILVYALIIPVSLIILTIVFFVLWLIQILMGI